MSSCLELLVLNFSNPYMSRTPIKPHTSLPSERSTREGTAQRTQHTRGGTQDHGTGRSQHHFLTTNDNKWHLMILSFLRLQALAYTEALALLGELERVREGARKRCQFE